MSKSFVVLTEDRLENATLVEAIEDLSENAISRGSIAKHRGIPDS